jgi:nitrate reductase NapE component
LHAARWTITPGVARQTAPPEARPTWLGWLSLVVGAAAAATVAFVGIFAWLAWILVGSVLPLVRRA